MNEQWISKPQVAQAFQWKGEEPNQDWPDWMKVAAKEYYRYGEAGFSATWPAAVVSISGQNTLGVKLAVHRPMRETVLWARPGDFIVRMTNGHWDVVDELRFRATFSKAPAEAGAPPVEPEPVRNVQVTCFHCKGRGQIENYTPWPTGDVLPPVYWTGDLVPCPGCNGWGVVIATELRAITAWKPLPKVDPS